MGRVGDPDSAFSHILDGTRRARGCVDVLVVPSRRTVRRLAVVASSSNRSENNIVATGNQVSDASE
jgi:hypothetical protein